MPYMNWGDFQAKVKAAGVTDQDDVDITSIDTISDDLVTIWVNGEEIEVKI
jgi:hypothetical protein